MSEEREKLAAAANDAVETASSCLGCYVALILLLATPMIVVAAWGLVGAAFGNDWIALVGAAAAAVGIIVTVIRLAGGQR